MAEVEQELPRARVCRLGELGWAVKVDGIVAALTNSWTQSEAINWARTYVYLRGVDLYARGCEVCRGRGVLTDWSWHLPWRELVPLIIQECAACHPRRPGPHFGRNSWAWP